MRLDHIAYRVANREKAADFFCNAFGYKIANEFEIFFDDAKKESARCLALEPPEKMSNLIPFFIKCAKLDNAEYHMAPEIFVSDGSAGSIVGNWVADRGGIGGVHHLAYQVYSVAQTMETWVNNGWAPFCSDKPLKCPDLTQVFTVPHPLTGVIYEFIERGKQGFCKENVRGLMESTKNK